MNESPVVEAGTQVVDVVVVGAGFAGLRALHTLRERGHSVVVLEAGEGVGGVWNWNRYPGARCDVESYDYSYGFSEELQQQWRWSERYAAQPEILRYLRHVAERFDLYPHIRLSTRMTSGTWDETAHRWRVETDNGLPVSARYLVMATGQLSTTKAPNLPGTDTFSGETYHTGQWPHTDVDLAGKRVGVIGTGSSGMQMIPVIASEVEHLTVFQRTPNFSVPASNAPITDEDDAQVKQSYAARRAALQNSPTGLSVPINPISALEVSEEDRRLHYESSWPHLGFGFVLAYRDLLTNQEANDTAADFIRGKIAEMVLDPQTREKLLPRGFPFGAKRPSVDSRYFETFNRDNVTLVDVRSDALEAIVPEGVRTSSGLHELDVLVFATGFDVFTGSLFRAGITGRGGITLQQKWSTGPRTFLGLMTADFPNMFVVAGPGSPSLLSNVIVSTEQHVDFIADLLDHMQESGCTVIEPTERASDDWVEHVNAKAMETLYPSAPSYYNGNEVAGKPRVFVPYSGGVRGYRRILEKVVADHYEGFVMSPSDTLATKAADRSKEFSHGA